MGNANQNDDLNEALTRSSRGAQEVAATLDLARVDPAVLEDLLDQSADASDLEVALGLAAPQK